MAEMFSRWFASALRDLDSAEFAFNGGRPELSAFLSQQAAEKALKSVYVLEFNNLWKIHD